MKKSLLIGLLFLCSLTLTGCFGNGNNEKSLLGRLGLFNIKDGPGMERDDDIPKGGERITVVTEMCEEEGGRIEEWNEGGDIQNVCFYPDESFCYLEELASNNCHKGDMTYNDEVVYNYPPEDQLNGKSTEEAFCEYNNGVITENKYGDRFCTFSDGGFYELRAFKELGEMPGLRGPDEPYCSDFEDIVCGSDGNGYLNECWMKSAGVEEETELAEVVDGKCIYG